MAELTCEVTRAALSARADGEPDRVDEAHLESCDACRRFETGLRSLRTALRFEVLDDAPDVAPAVLDRVSRASAPRRRSYLPVAAALLAGVLVGAAFVWPSDGGGVASASLPARIVAAQRDVSSVAADLVIVDATGTHTGSLRYRAPESLLLEVGAARLGTSDGAWFAPGRGAATGVEPFAADGPMALDLVLPASAFTVGAPPPVLGERAIDGRDAVGVHVTAAQVGALLGGFRGVGVAGDVHPTDDVELWLDREHLVPVRATVRAAAGPDRARWAAARGIDASAGEVVLDVRFADVIVNDAESVDGLAPAVAPHAVHHGFRDGPVDGVEPAWLPDGMQPWRAGTVGDVAVRTWTDGRAWIKVRATHSWSGDRLFGGLDRAVRRVVLGDGVGYVGDGGGVVAVHAADLDLVVLGSVAPAELRRVAASIAVVGGVVPSTWDEAAVLDEGAAPLVLPAATGFAPPAVRVESDTVTMTFAGAGERVVVLATRPGDVLGPPIDADAVGVLVRGTTARWNPAGGDLEWIEDGRAWSLRSRTVGLGELMALADALVAP